MKVYWSDREGNSPPPNCIFNFRPFFHDTKQKGSYQRIETLPNAGSVKVLKRTFLPTKEMWIRGVEKALDAIHKKTLQKVVLARICTLELEVAPDPFVLVAALKQKAQGAFVFCIESKTSSFFGATPERLFNRNGREILSEAVAGTRPRGKTLLDDENYKKDLLTCPKDLREFSPVQRYLQEALSPLCQDTLNFTPLTIHQTQNVQHLYSKCSGRLKESITDIEILKHLHPTPALCGTPKEKAMSLIQEIEPFERGLYGGAIGWTTPEAAEFIVGIRSCRLQGKTATLYSGTGIVEGSDPEAEWEELNQKLKLYDEIFQ